MGIKGTLAAHGPDQRVHVLQVPHQRPAPGRRQPKLGSGNPSVKALGASNVMSLFQLSGMDAEISIRRLQQSLQIHKCQRFIGGQ
jgi:hypothetical protein